MPSTVLEYEPPPAALRRTMVLVGWGIFVSTLAQTVTIGSLPLKVMLKDKLGVTPTQMALFFQLANLAWYFKPVAGLLSDSFPLFGTRRRQYLILGCIASAIGWIVLALVPRTYACLLWAAIAVNVALVVVSSATGGLLVEEGQKLGATGRLSSARSMVMYIAVFLVGPTGGWLATRAFGLTAGIAAVMLLSYIPPVWFLLKEPRAAKANKNALVVAWVQIKLAVSSRGLWMAAGLLFLVHLSPGFQTPLYYHMSNNLHYSPAFIGVTDAVTGVAGIVASFIYLWICRRMSLRLAYSLTIVAAAVGALPFLFLASKTSAILICFVYGLGMILADVASLDLAARATPKGVEAMGYALMISFWNIGIAVSDVSGSFLYDRWHMPFSALVWINAGTTALVLFAVPFLPRRLMNGREGETMAEFRPVPDSGVPPPINP